MCVMKIAGSIKVSLSQVCINAKIVRYVQNYEKINKIVMTFICIIIFFVINLIVKYIKHIDYRPTDR